MPLRVGIIGAGGMGNYYAGLLTKIPEIELVALCDVNEKRLKEVAARYGVKKKFTDWRELVARDDIDAVFVCTPVKFHKEITVEALKHGKHVMCEKPPAMNAKEAEEMARTAEKEKRLLMYAFQWRFMPESRFIKSLITRGELGKVYRVRLHYLRQSGAPYGAGGWFRLKELAGGGVLIDCAVHFIDLAYWLIGRPKPLYALGMQYNYLGRELGDFTVEDTYVGLVIFEDDTSMVVEASWLQTWPNEHQVRLYGTLGSASLLPIEVVKKYDNLYLNIKPQLPKCDANVEKLKHFAKIAESGIYEDITPTAYDGVVVMKIIDALYKSAQEKTMVKIE